MNFPKFCSFVLCNRYMSSTFFLFCSLLMNRESAAHGNFHFIGPALTVMCQSIKEKVLSLSDDSNVKIIRKGQILYLLHNNYYK